MLLIKYYIIATFKAGSLTKDSYADWIDLVEGHATDSGLWKFIDPNNTVEHFEPKEPAITDYVSNAKKLADLDDDDKIMFREDNAQYRVDMQIYKQEMKIIGELRAKIVESLHPNHRKLIFGHMTCRQVLKQIKDRLEPPEDLQQLKLINDYSQAR